MYQSSLSSLSLKNLIYQRFVFELYWTKLMPEISRYWIWYADTLKSLLLPFICFIVHTGTQYTGRIRFYLGLGEGFPAFRLACFYAPNALDRFQKMFHSRFKNGLVPSCKRFLRVMNNDPKRLQNQVNVHASKTKDQQINSLLLCIQMSSQDFTQP